MTVDATLSPPAEAGKKEGARGLFRNLSYWALLPSWLLMAFALMGPIAIVAAVSVASRGAYGGFTWDFNFASYYRILFVEGWTGESEFNPQYLLIILRAVVLEIGSASGW